MIKVDQTTREIQFIPDKTVEDRPPPRDFPLLSAYVCPFCNRILAAYFRGYLSESDIAYYQKESHYVIGSVSGGHYVKLESHEGYGYYGSEKCAWELFAKRGVIQNLRAFVERHGVPRMLVHKLADKIRQLPGFILIDDVCGKDGEMLLFSEDELLGDIRKREGFDAYWEVKQKLGDYLMKVVKKAAG